MYLMNFIILPPDLLSLSDEAHENNTNLNSPDNCSDSTVWDININFKKSAKILLKKY